MKHSLLKLSILSILLSLGCNSIKLARDPAPAPIDLDYPTLEVAACGQRGLGMSGCILKVGSRMDSIALSVVTLGTSGELHVFSSQCLVDAVFAYSNADKGVGMYSVDLRKFLGDELQLNHRCLLTLTMFPTYSNQENQDVKIKGFRGYVYIRAVENASPGVVRAVNKRFVSGVASAKLRSKQLSPVSAQDVKRVSLFLNGSRKGLYRIERCNGLQALEGSYSDVDHLEFDWEELLGKSSYGIEDSCILQGRAVPEDLSEDVAWVLNAKVFNVDAAKLPIPAVTIDGDEVELEGSEFVSITSVNGVLKNSNSVEFDVEPNKEYFVRQYTAQGRALLGIFKNGAFEWEN